MGCSNCQRGTTWDRLGGEPPRGTAWEESLLEGPFERRVSARDHLDQVGQRGMCACEDSLVSVHVGGRECGWYRSLVWGPGPYEK